MMKKTFNRVLRLSLNASDIFATKRYLVLGDSHSQIFKNHRFKINFPFAFFDVCNVEGATVSGLENPNSKTNALSIFQEKLHENVSKKKIIFLIGEVDTGFVIWYRAEKYNSSVQKMLQKALNNYYYLLLQAKEIGEILVISAPLPTITDDNDWGEVASLRKEVRASQLERTNLTLLFNKELEKFCRDNNMDFLNLDKDSLGEDGTVKKELLNSNRNDHHYASSSYSKLIINKIGDYL